MSLSFAGLTLVTPPVANPVSIAEAKAHSRIFTNLDDSSIAGYITAATKKCELNTWRALLTQQWRYSLQSWPGRPQGNYRTTNTRDEYYRWASIKIPLPPLVSIEEFAYFDTNNNKFLMAQGYSNTVGNYFVDTEHEPGRACLPFAGIWPTTVLLPSSPIRITYTAGWPYLTGIVNVDVNGLVTAISPPAGDLFVPGLVGSWITIADQSFVVGQYLNPYQLQLAAPPSVAIANAIYSGNTVPMAIRQAILFLAAHFYENREPIETGRGLTAIEIPGTVDDLLADYRVFEYANEGADA